LNAHRLEARMKNRGYLSSGQHAYLAGMAAASGVILQESNLVPPKIALDRMFFLSAFQAGVDHFVAPLTADVRNELEFLKKRSSDPPAADWEVAAGISRVCQAFVRTEKNGLAARSFAMLLSDLVCAMRNDAALLSLVPIPSAAAIQEVFEPELALPLTQLMAMLEPHSESLPAPTVSIEREHVTRFKEILDSRAFTRYSENHALLQQASSEVGKTLADVRRVGTALVQDSKRLLTTRPAVLHTLGLVPKLVDSVFGKLPGALAQLAGDAAERHIKERKRLVVYRFDKWAIELLLQQHKQRKSEGTPAD